MKFKLWGGDPAMEGMLEEYSAELSRLDAGDSEVQTCRQWMNAAQQALKSEFLGFLPYHTYDRTWGFINLMRHKFCLLLPPDRLLPLVGQVRACLDYVVESGRREALAKDLQLVEDSLIAQLKGMDGNGATPPYPQEQRLRLENLSRATAEARETHWRKINLLRMRLVVSAICLGTLLALGIVLVPTVLQEPGVGRLHMLAMVVFGALGGLVSALQSTESLQARASAYFLQRTLLALRPVVGAAAGLLVYLVQFSEIVSFFPSTEHPGAAHLALAFVAGFSERFFIGNIGRLAKSGIQIESVPSADQEKESPAGKQIPQEPDKG